MQFHKLIERTIGKYEPDNPLRWQRGPVYGVKEHPLVNTLIESEAADLIRNVDVLRMLLPDIDEPHFQGKDDLEKVFLEYFPLPEVLPVATPLLELHDKSFPSSRNLHRFRTGRALSGRYLLDCIEFYSHEACVCTADIRLFEIDGLCWFTNDNLTFSNGGRIIEEPEKEEKRARLLMYVKGDLTIEEGSEILLPMATIFVGGDVICNGFIDIKGTLAVAGEIKVGSSGEIRVEDFMADCKEHFMGSGSEEQDAKASWETGEQEFAFIDEVPDFVEWKKEVNAMRVPEWNPQQTPQVEEGNAAFGRDPLHDHKGQPEFLSQNLFYVDPNLFREMSPLDFLDIHFNEKESKDLNIAVKLFNHSILFPDRPKNDGKIVIFYEETFPSTCNKPVAIAYEMMGGEYVFGGLKIYGDESCFYDAKIALHGKKGLRWYVDGSLIMSKDSEIKPAEGWEEDGSFLDLFVKGNLRIREGCSIRGIKARIIVCGMLVCDGEVDIEGELYAMSGESGKTEPKVRRMRAEESD